MNHAPLQILLVEDNPDDEELALTALHASHLTGEIHVAHDGAQALQYLARCGSQPVAADQVDTPDLVLLDLKMPKVGGLDVLRFIKGNPATSATPVVMLTSSKEERDVNDSYALGANSYIVKPVAYEPFAEALRQVVQYWLAFNQPPEVAP